MTALVDRLERLHASSSPAPWFVIGYPWNPGPPWINAGCDDPHAGRIVCDFAAAGENVEDITPTPDEDAALIVELRNALPELLALAHAAHETTQTERQRGSRLQLAVAALFGEEAA